MTNYMESIHNRLKLITKDCRPDMHAPDEQAVSARVVGDHLDNARGEHISFDAIERGYQEYVVIITRNGMEERFNLADLIALARVAK